MWMFHYLKEFGNKTSTVSSILSFCFVKMDVVVLGRCCKFYRCCPKKGLFSRRHTDTATNMQKYNVIKINVYNSLQLINVVNNRGTFLCSLESSTHRQRFFVREFLFKFMLMVSDSIFVWMRSL